MSQPAAPSEEGTGCAAALPVLVGGAHRLGLDLTPRQRERFERYCTILSEANRRLNLTGVRGGEGVMRTLFLDSLTVALALPERLRVEGIHPRVVDVGAGPGIPGLPLKIAFPWWDLALVESVRKKAAFLEGAIAELDLNGVTVIARRAEELGQERTWRDQSDLCVARAVAALPTLLEYCGPLVRRSGLLVFPKSGAVAEEVAAAAAAAGALGVQVREIVAVPEELDLGAGRAIVVYEKIGPTPSGYPRRLGLARSRPIGAAPTSRLVRPRAGEGTGESAQLPDPATR